MALTTIPTQQDVARTEATSQSSISVAVYVAGAITLALITLAAVVGVAILRPDADNASINTTIGMFVGPLMATLIVLIQNQNHKQLNSRFEQFSTGQAIQARAEGVAAGSVDRRAPPPVDTAAIVAAVLAAMQQAAVVPTTAITQPVPIVADEPLPVKIIATVPVPVVESGPPKPPNPR